MFNEREMSKAIDWLFELFSPEDYEGYDEDEMASGILKGSPRNTAWTLP